MHEKFGARLQTAESLQRTLSHTYVYKQSAQIFFSKLKTWSLMEKSHKFNLNVWSCFTGHVILTITAPPDLYKTWIYPSSPHFSLITLSVHFLKYKSPSSLSLPLPPSLALSWLLTVWIYGTCIFILNPGPEVIKVTFLQHARTSVLLIQLFWVLSPTVQPACVKHVMAVWRLGYKSALCDLNNAVLWNTRVWGCSGSWLCDSSVIHEFKLSKELLTWDLSVTLHF